MRSGAATKHQTRYNIKHVYNLLLVEHLVTNMCSARGFQVWTQLRLRPSGLRLSKPLMPNVEGRNQYGKRNGALC